MPLESEYWGQRPASGETAYNEGEADVLLRGPDAQNFKVLDVNGYAQFAIF